MSRIPNWIDVLLRGYYAIRDGSDVDYPERARTKFTGSGVSVADDPTNGQTVVTVSGTFTYGTPVAVGLANAAGSATSVARSDHVHDLTETTFRAVAAELTASLNVNSQKITGLANGTSSSDAAAFGQIPSTTLLTTAISAAIGSNRYVEATADGITLTLPASPTPRQHVTVNGPASTTSIVVSGNGNAINGSSAFILTSPNESIELVFMSTEWRIV